jgi:glycosyltransferase involved in cell wall biosynthesis
MRILFTTHRFYPDIGGIEVNSEILARYFFDKGHSVVLVTQSEVVDTIDFFPFSVIRRPTLFQLFLLTREADIVYQNNIELKTLIPAILLGKKYVIAIRTWVRSTSGQIRVIDRLKRLIIKKAHASISISKAIKDDTCIDSIVIGNPFRSSLFRYKPSIFRTIAFAFVGRLVDDKGVDLIINAMAVLLEDKSIIESCRVQKIELSLTIIGDGPERENLESLVDKLSISNCVEFVGFVEGESLVNSLNKHYICVIPSRWKEPFGNVALEAMACGCIVLGSDAGGLVDAIGTAGLTFKRNNIHDLINSLRRLIISPDLRSSLRRNAKSHLVNHTEIAVGQRYLNVLESV